MIEPLVVALLMAPAPGGIPAALASAAQVAPAAPSRTVIRRVILRVDGLPWDEVHDALAPRLPGVELLPFAQAGFTATEGELLAYVELSVAPDGEAVDLTVVLSDRRAYLRHFTPAAERSARSIAITVANTLAAIEQEQIAPDERDKDIPRPSSASPPVSSKSGAGQESPRFELGIGGALHPTFGLAPATVRGFAALGGELRASIHHPRGLRVALGLRIGGRARGGYRLWRERVHLAVGYGWQRERFGVAAMLGPTVEPWRVRRDGAVVPPQPESGAPLLGALMAVTPSFRHAVSPRVTLGLGLRTELATSVLRSGGAARVLHSSAMSPAELFGLGGLELTTALELTVWIGLPPADEGESKKIYR